MENRKSLIIAPIAITICLFALGCGDAMQKQTNTNQAAETRVPGTRGGSLTYRLAQPVTTLNYMLAADEPSVIVTLFVMNSRLISFDPEKQQHVPSLAESYTMQPDGQTVDLVLRDGLKFSDGQPLTTDDVIFTLEAIYDERTQAAAFRDGMLIGGKPISMKKVDERRMQFVFPERIALAENYLENLAVLPKHVLSAARDAGKLAETWKIDSDPAAVVTSGPFVVGESVPGEKLVLRRNPHYWGRDANGQQLPYLDELVLEVVADANNAFVRLGQGSIDIADRIRGTDYASLKTSGGAVKAIDLGPGFANDHIWFNLNRSTPDGKPLANQVKYAWFSDKRFRKAVSHAVDRNSIATNTLQGLATPLFGFVSAANKAWLDPSLPKPEYSLDKAGQLLTDAGFVRRGTPDSPELFDADGNRVEFTLVVQDNNEQRKLTAAVIQQDLAKLGIKMNIANVDTAALTKMWTTTFDYDAISLGLAVTGTDPSASANFLLSSAAVHQWQPSQKQPATEWEARIDRLYREQAKEPDQAKRRELFYEIQRIMAEESPIIPIVSRHIVSAANSRVGNYAPSVMLPYSLWNAEELFVRN